MIQCKLTARCKRGSCFEDFAAPIWLDSFPTELSLEQAWKALEYLRAQGILKDGDECLYVFLTPIPIDV